MLVGDYLYSRAFQMMVSLGNMRIMDVMAERHQHDRRGRSPAAHERARSGHDASSATSRSSIARPRKLFEAGAQIAAILAGAPAAIEGAMTRYGRHLGMAFQLVDDVLDYRADREATRQEPRRRPGRGQADAASDLCAAGTAPTISGALIRRSIEQGSVGGPRADHRCN